MFDSPEKPLVTDFQFTMIKFMISPNPGEPLRPDDLRRIIRIILDGVRARPDGRTEERI